MEASLDRGECLDVADETIGPLGTCIPIHSKDLGEEAGLFLLLADHFVVVVELVLVDTDDALLLCTQTVHLYHNEFLVKGGLAYSNRQSGGDWDLLRLLLFEEAQITDYLCPVSSLKFTLVDESFGLNLNGAFFTKILLDSKFFISKSLGRGSSSFWFSVRK